jgi:hypothetical protein
MRAESKRVGIEDTSWRQRRRATLFALFVGVFVAGGTASCRAKGRDDGAACARAPECESLVCSFSERPDVIGPDGATGVCVGKCQSSDQCSAGRVCGRYDFRGTIPDSGGPDVEPVREGPDFEILRACRPRITVPCARDEECRPSEGCLGAPSGVCAPRCTSESGCGVTRLCLANRERTACREPGLCAVTCDDNIECPAGFYCQFAYSSAAISGRCAPMQDLDSGCAPETDAAVENTDGASAVDANDSSAVDAAAIAVDAGARSDGSVRAADATVADR